MCMHGYHMLIMSTDKQLLTFSGLLLHGMQELGDARGVWSIIVFGT